MELRLGSESLFPAECSPANLIFLPSFSRLLRGGGGGGASGKGLQSA